MPRAFLSRWRERQGASGSDTDETAPPQPRLVPAVAMGDLSVDPVTFWERLSKLHKTWNVRGRWALHYHTTVNTARRPN